MLNRKSTAYTPSFFNFSPQDFYLSKLRAEAKKHQGIFDSQSLFAYGLYKKEDERHVQVKVQTTTISNNLLTIATLAPGKHHTKDATTCLKAIEVALAVIEQLTEERVSFPELKEWQNAQQLSAAKLETAKRSEMDEVCKAIRKSLILCPRSRA